MGNQIGSASGRLPVAGQRDALQAAAVDAVIVCHDCTSGVRDDRPGPRDSILGSKLVSRTSGSRHNLLAVVDRDRA